VRKANLAGQRAKDMTDDEIDVAWSKSVAALAADALVDAKLIIKADLDKATAIIAEEVHVRLVAKDRPDRTNWKYKSN
jgi:hypothetical protein